jgi:hypothetical protein
MNWTWRKYVEEIYEKEHHGVDQRLAMLDHVREWIIAVPHFSDIETEKRKFIAGAPNKEPVKGWGFFGSMKGNGSFVNLVIENNPNISQALDLIPFTGVISQSQYEDYVAAFQQAFVGTHFENANNIATATRLLAMKRPDTFVCYDKANKQGLCEDFRLKQTGMDFISYWEDVICRIRECVWYNSPAPREGEERGIWEARAAFLDSLYYLNE